MLKRFVALVAATAVAAAVATGGAGTAATTAVPLSVTATCQAPGSTLVDWTGRSVSIVTLSWYDAFGDLVGQTGRYQSPWQTGGGLTAPSPYTAVELTVILRDKQGRFLTGTMVACVA